MLNKNEIIKELKNEEFIVRNAVYEYVCNLHLYDDNEINEALIEFIKENYSEINMSGLRFSKVNKQIIQCLIDISLNEDDEFIKESIDKVLINHYSLIKDLDYNFEKMIINKNDLLLYKKIKHFSRKNADELLELYINNIKNFYLNDEDTIITEIIRIALGIALTQTEEGIEKLLMYFIALIEKGKKDNDFSSLLNVHVPYLVYPLCSCARKEYSWAILELYIQNMDFIGYADECNHYFSSICNNEFVNDYLERLKEIKRSEREAYYYDIAKYLNSDIVDEFLFKELKSIKDEEIQENIIRILSSRFNKNIITYALDFAKTGNYYDEEGFKLAIAPLLILEKEDERIAKEIIEEAKEEYLYNDDIEEPIFSEILKNFQEFILKDKEHIKEYRKARKLHQQIMDDMMRYYEVGMFELEKISPKSDELTSTITLLDTYFDTSTRIGAQALSNLIVYKNAPDIPCITEEFIKNNKYRKEEKKTMLNSMLNSESGLFEIIKTDREKGQIYLKNVFNNNNYCITDIALSSNLNNERHYIYTRIITYNGISFGTGFLLPFNKEDEYINKWIKETKEGIHKKQDFTQFIELYNAYIKSDKKIEVLMNKF
jgi:hypothetical protein